MESIIVIAPEWLDAVYPASLRERLSRSGTSPQVVPGREIESTCHSLESVRHIFSGWGAPLLSDDILSRLPRLECIFHAGGSVRQLLPPTFWNRRIPVTTAAWINAIPVADFTYAMVVLGLKQAWRRSAALVQSTPWKDAGASGLYGARIGLMSLSKVGRLVIERFKDSGAELNVYDPTVDFEEARRLGVQLVSLRELFSSCDVVSCHTPLLPHTRNLVGEDLLTSMKSGAVFINTARGAIVDEPALCAVLRARRDLFAILDVTTREPLEETSPLRSLPNVFLTPHIAGSLGRECARLGEFVVEEFERFRTGVPLRGVLHSDTSELIA
jgi:phosphoglycerate dehydrogenase-like enzyme